ncbi:unnamed protein product [Gordionus sp. m RMFG-2023]
MSLSVVWKRAKENILVAQDRQKRDYQKRLKDKIPYEVGQQVLIWNSRRADRKGGKMSDPWLGLYIIDKVYENDLYSVSNKDNTLLKRKYNGCNLKPYFQKYNNGEEEKENTDKIILYEEPDISLLPYLATNNAWKKYHAQRLGIRHQE